MCCIGQFPKYQVSDSVEIVFYGSICCLWYNTVYICDHIFLIDHYGEQSEVANIH